MSMMCTILYILHTILNIFSFCLIYNGNEAIDNPILYCLFPIYQDI